MIDDLRVDASIDPVKYVERPGVRGPTVAELAEDLIEKVNAGSALVYSMYHRPAEWWRDQPDPLCRAYMRACAAYGVGTHGRKPEDSA